METENPRLRLPPEYLEMIEYWRAYAPPPGRIGGMAAGYLPAHGHLPEAGGYGDQAAIMLDAFAVMSAAEAELLAGARP